MTFTELLEATKEYDLEAMGVFLGKPADKVDSISCFQDGDEWIMLVTDDRQKISEKRGKEEEIVRKVYGNIKLLEKYMGISSSSYGKDKE